MAATPRLAIKACVFLRASSHYRADVFRAGFERHGFTVIDRFDPDPQEGDVLLLWNRRRAYDHIAAKYESAGARVIIAENGYLPDPRSNKAFALALDHHNGAGRWYVGDRQRFDIPEEPWRTRGKQVVVLPQRGIGPLGVAMPHAWAKNVERKLRRITDRPIFVRKHPGAAKTDPYEHLRGAHCAVTWASGAGLKSIRFGVPVFHALPQWIGQSAATRLADSIEDCMTGDRSDLWRAVTWAQWTPEEIETGEALERLLHAEDRDLFRTSKQAVQNCRASHVGGIEPARRSA